MTDICLTVRSNEKLDDDVDMPPLGAAPPPKPVPLLQRAPLRPGDLQKWVQCARCSQWRKVRCGWRGRHSSGCTVGIGCAAPYHASAPCGVMLVEHCSLTPGAVNSRHEDLHEQAAYQLSQCRKSSCELSPL